LYLNYASFRASGFETGFGATNLPDTGFLLQGNCETLIRIEVTER